MNRFFSLVSFSVRHSSAHGALAGAVCKIGGGTCPHALWSWRHCYRTS